MIQLIRTNGLFTRWGKLMQLPIDVNAFQNGTALTDLNNMLSQFLVTPDQTEITAISDNYFSILDSFQTVSNTVQQAAAAILNQMVYNDNPQISRDDVGVSYNELLRQMSISTTQTGTIANTLFTITGLTNTNYLCPGQTVTGVNIPPATTIVSIDSPTQITMSLAATGNATETITFGPQSVQLTSLSGVSAAAQGVTNIGNGLVVVGVKRGDGRYQELLFAEKGNLVCTADGQPNGGAVAGNEQFTWTGDVPASDNFSREFPLGSGSSTTITVINASNNNDGLNLINGGDFETFTVPPTPDNWVIVTGAGQCSQDLVNFFTGISSLKIAGDGATHVELTQQFNSTTGSAYSPPPNTQFAIGGWLRLSAVPGAGVLQFALVDQTDTIINDQQGIADSFTVSLPAQPGTTWVPFSGIFRTPNALPTQINLRIKMTTPLSVGVNLNLDHIGFAQPTQLYSSGGNITIFSGSVNFIAGNYAYAIPDQFTVTFTNNRGGAAVAKGTWQTALDSFFGLGSAGLLAPSSSSPTIPDSLL